MTAPQWAILGGQRPATPGDAQRCPGNRLSNQIFRAQMTLTRRSGQTVIRIRPGGTSSEFPINWIGLARKIRHVLASAPGIR
jgi:hypothetical protein